MMKKGLYILMAFMVLVVCSSATLKKGDKKQKDVAEDAEVYGFGFAASFIDTLAFYTDIQPLDSAKILDKKFLDQRYQYSYQLNDYLESKLDKQNYVCMIFFNKDRKKIHKEFDKLLAKYQKSGVGMRPITVSDFKFRQPE